MARGVNFLCCLGLVGALGLAAISRESENWNAARKCLWAALVFAVVLILFPGPDFFRALDGRP
jgi:hypothetical protein